MFIKKETWKDTWKLLLLTVGLADRSFLIPRIPFIIQEQPIQLIRMKAKREGGARLQLQIHQQDRTVRCTKPHETLSCRGIYYTRSAHGSKYFKLQPYDYIYPPETKLLSTTNWDPSADECNSWPAFLPQKWTHKLCNHHINKSLTYAAWSEWPLNCLFSS